MKAWDDITRASRVRDGKLSPEDQPYLSVFEAKTDEELVLGNLQLLVEMLTAQNLAQIETYDLAT